MDHFSIGISFLEVRIPLHAKMFSGRDGLVSEFTLRISCADLSCRLRPWGITIGQAVIRRDCRPANAPGGIRVGYPGEFHPMIRGFFQARSRGIPAEKRTLIIASLKLILFVLILSFSFSEIILLTGDNAVYGGKKEFIAWHCGVAVFSLGMIVDASWVLRTNRQSTTAGKRRGAAGVLLDTMIMILSPVRFLWLVIIVTATVLLLTAISLLANIF
jgi:hypothetical protein